MFALIFSLVLLSASIYLFSKFDNSYDILTEIRNTYKSWGLFWAAVLIEMVIDYFLRRSDGNIRNGGLPENYWLLIQFVLAVIISFPLYKKIALNKGNIFKTFFVSIQVLYNIVLFLLVKLFYVIGSGIESI